MRDAVGAVQSILLVGGSSEIGLALVRRLASARRARVVLAGRDPAGLRALGPALAAAGAGPVEVVAFDARVGDAHERVVRQAFGGGDVDVAIVAVGLLGDEHAAARDPAAAHEIAEVNFAGLVPVLTAVAERMRAQGHGALVVLSSFAAVRPRPATAAYGAAKAGLDAFARGLDGTLGGSGVRVLVVRPGFVRTRMTAGLREAPFSVDPRAVAAAAERGLADGRRVVWVPAVLRWAALALTALPERVVRRLPR